MKNSRLVKHLSATRASSKGKEVKPVQTAEFCQRAPPKPKTHHTRGVFLFLSFMYTSGFPFSRE
jgi:hypothetical protein